MRSRVERFLVIGSLAALAVSLPAEAQRRGDCRGMVATGAHGVVAGADEPGERMAVAGRVVDRDGAPLAGVNILAYQTDDEGYYSPRGTNESDARLCVVIATDAEGRYSLDTIRPGAYPTGGVPAHIHFELWGDGVGRQRRDLQFADDLRLSERRRREVSRFSTVQAPERDEAGVWRVTRDFRID